MNRKQVIFSGIFVLAIIGLVVYLRFQPSSQAPAVSNNENGGTSVPSETTNPGTQTGGGQTSGGTTQQPSTGLTDGSYTGNAADAFYGTVQVKAVVSGGKLTNVQILQKPNSAGHTQEVSSFSLPQLVSEAIAAQSSQVDVVSGATQTSQAFMQSLHSALAQAGSSEQNKTQVTPPGGSGGHLPM